MLLNGCTKIRFCNECFGLLGAHQAPEIYETLLVFLEAKAREQALTQLEARTCEFGGVLAEVTQLTRRHT